MKTRLFILLLAVALGSAGITYSITRRSMERGSPAAGQSHADEGGEHGHVAGIEGLRTAVAVVGEGWDVVTATGRLSVPPDRLVKISPRIEGKVVAAYGTVGDTVRRGQVLAVISSMELAEARAQYRQAVARLDAAERNYEHEQRSARLGAVSARPVEEARSASLASEGDLADAKGELAQVKSELAREESELAQCKSRLDRARDLYADGIVSKQDLESAETEHKRDCASVDAVKSRIAQAESKLEKARSALDISRQYLAREERVYKGRVLDTRALQAAKADVTAAKIDMRAAADRIRVLGASTDGSGETITIVSPISGRIVSRNTNVGEMAAPSDVMFIVADLSRVWVEADVYEKDLAIVRTGQAVEIRVDTYPERVFTGRVDSVGDILSPDSRTAKVRCTVPNAQGLLRGEMFARVTLITSRRGETVLVPRQAVLDDAGGKIVFTPCTECEEDKDSGESTCGSFKKLEVKTGPVQGDKVEILAGLEPGTEVVTVGAYQLKTALGSGKLEAGCSDGH